MPSKILFATVCSASLLSINTSQAAFPNGVAAGDVNQTSAVLWSRSDTLGALSFEYATDANFTTVLGQMQKTVTDPIIPVKVSISALNANTRYYYRVTDSTGANASGTFKTLAELGTKTNIRFGVSGDWRGELAPYPALRNVPDRNLDFFVSLGDSIYADYATPDLPKEQASSLEDYRIKHNEVYREHHGMNTLADLRASTPIYAVIDDHEVTDDFAGGADVSSDSRFVADSADTLINKSTLYRNGLQAFLEYNPIAVETYPNTGSDARTDGAIKLYRERILGSNAMFINLDERSFRDQALPAASNPLDPVQVSQYLIESLSAERTLLGARQLADLKHALLNAQRHDITWKFIGVPEPIQNIGVMFASDRYEGYARERTELLKFIDDHAIENVVFISADIHGTLINNLAYQELTATGIKQIPLKAFEITTGSVAFYKPFGDKILELAKGIPVSADLSLTDAFLKNIGVPDIATFDALPSATKNQAFNGLINQQITPLDYSPVGLEDSGLDVTLLQGGYSSLFTFGWTEFEIDATSQKLLVTTYGIKSYSPDDISNSIEQIIQREPVVISQFSVNSVNTDPKNCAVFNGQSLSLPCVKSGDSHYQAQLSVTADANLSFNLNSSERIPAALDQCAYYDRNTGEADLPCVRVGTQSFWVQLKRSDHTGAVFALKDYNVK